MIPSFLYGQKKLKSYEDYIEKYNYLAIQHMARYKIPASITLAQGLLESNGGQSSLAAKSNNHFGIKCHKSWDGKRVYHKDDIPNDCFRKYNSVEDSFDDHSTFLVNGTRYAGLFELDIYNFGEWAKKLQEYGYATDKGYANKLINLIETYELYKFDTGRKSEDKKKDNDKSQKNNKPQKIKQNRDVFRTYGLIYVMAKANDSFDNIAYDLGFKVKDLIKYNEVPEDFPLMEGDIIYLEKKKSKAEKPNYEHVVEVGESMHSISQRFGIQFKNLYKINKLNSEYVPEEGDVLKLR